jgi:hypothetical protein
LMTSSIKLMSLMLINCLQTLWNPTNVLVKNPQHIKIVIKAKQFREIFRNFENKPKIEK